jgi:hypothetical protein
MRLDAAASHRAVACKTRSPQKVNLTRIVNLCELAGLFGGHRYMFLPFWPQLVNLKHRFAGAGFLIMEHPAAMYLYPRPISPRMHQFAFP